jgi:hypothetical protein
MTQTNVLPNGLWWRPVDEDGAGARGASNVAPRQVGRHLPEAARSISLAISAGCDTGEAWLD